MPRPMWHHPCCDTPGGLSSTPTCSRCGRAGTYEGWHLGMHESMARYQYVFGLKPLGPHRREADRVLGPLRADCQGCDGRGTITLAGGEWLACAACEGTGGMWRLPPAEVDAAVRGILERYPEALPRHRPADFLHGAVILDLASSEIISLKSAGEAPGAAPVTPASGPGLLGQWRRLVAGLLGRRRRTAGRATT